MKQETSGCDPTHGITSNAVDTTSPHFKKPLPKGETRVIVAGCRGITLKEVQNILSQTIGIELGEERISLEYRGFMISLPPNAVAFLLEGYLSQVRYNGRPLEVLYSDGRGTEKRADENRDLRTGRIVEFQPPQEWTDADNR